MGETVDDNITLHCCGWQQNCNVDNNITLLWMTTLLLCGWQHYTALLRMTTLQWVLQSCYAMVWRTTTAILTIVLYLTHKTCVSGSGELFTACRPRFLVKMSRHIFCRNPTRLPGTHYHGIVCTMVHGPWCWLCHIVRWPCQASRLTFLIYSTTSLLVY